MLAWPLSTWMILLLATFLVSATVCWLAIRYANRRQLIDQPGRRRSHVVATPRGGGIGIVVAVLAGLLATMVGDPGSVTGWPRREELALLSLGGGVLIVAAVGWLDDHRSLGAGIRLCAHVLAVVVSLLPILLIDVPSLSGNPVMPWVLAALAVACIAAVWSINLHNFMDGINGLLAFQAVFVFVALGLLCARSGHAVDAQRIGLFVAATLGFLPFNFPRARIFMGDVGSGSLGLLVAASIGWQVAAMPNLIYAGLIACSGFMVDASATLLSRMLGGRRWYSAHREHLYQWLVRSGMSHAKVVALYMTWNLLIVTPALLLAAIEADDVSTTGALSAGGAAQAGLVFALAQRVWVLGKQYCLRAVSRARRRTP